MKPIVLSLITVVALLAMPGLALAHPHGYPHGGLGAGLLHPLLGLDHLLAMFGFGLWAAQQRYRRTFWLVPSAFLAALVLGFGLGLGASPQPLVEIGIVGSLGVVGLLIAFKRQLPLIGAAAMAGLFAVFHGHAHGVEMAVGLSGHAFGAGFVTGSAILLAAGVAAWRFAEQRMLEASISRSLGASLLLASAVFLVVLV